MSMGLAVALAALGAGCSDTESRKVSEVCHELALAACEGVAQCSDDGPVPDQCVGVLTQACCVDTDCSKSAPIHSDLLRRCAELVRIQQCFPQEQPAVCSTLREELPPAPSSPPAPAERRELMVEDGNGTALCALGWRGNLSASSNGGSIRISASCGDYVDLVFASAPPVGGSTRCSEMHVSAGNKLVVCGIAGHYNAYGEVTVSRDATGQLRVAGSCLCPAGPSGASGPYQSKASFDLPLELL
ncbi:MAG: hypothetical protein IT370_20415 [Deltaproteobacteria bacterium]|nr:hypothetical protein [Deltaproteobacteria bacterium]